MTLTKVNQETNTEPKKNPRTRDTCLHILEIKVGRIAFILNSEAIVVTGSGSCTLNVPTIVWIVGFTILK